MKIKIKYDSSWGSSFHDKPYEEEKTKKGSKWSSGKFIGSSKGKDYFKQIKKDITKDTVLGILYRLLGDPRQLSQIKKESNPFFNPEKISFEDNFRETDSVVSLLNTNGDGDTLRTPQSPEKDPRFLGSLFSEIWSPAFLTDPDDILKIFVSQNGYVDKTLPIKTRLELVDFIIPADAVGDSLKKRDKKHPLISEVTDLKAIKKYRAIVSNFGNIKKSIDDLKITYQDLKIILIHLNYQNVLVNHPDLPKKIVGFYYNGIDKRSFCEDILLDSCPSRWTRWLEEEGKKSKDTFSLRVKDGELTIHIDTPDGENIKEMIEDAGVHTFIVGKKGLGYISKIEV